MFDVVEGPIIMKRGQYETPMLEKINWILPQCFLHKEEEEYKDFKR